MQVKKKEVILKAISKTVKRLRGDKSQFMIGAEFDIPSSVISDLEREVKDPQLTTLMKLSRAFGLTISEFMLEFEKELPSDFSVCDE